MVQTIPSYEEMMPAVLKVLADGQHKPLTQVYDEVAGLYGVSAEQLALTLPSGKQTYVRSRVGWAKTYLVKSGLINQPKRGICAIIQRGRETLASGQLINNDHLTKFDDFNHFLNAQNEPLGDNAPGKKLRSLGHNDDRQTPTELMAQAFAALNSALADELLE